MKRIAIFASGSGSNAEKIIQHFATVDNVEVAGVYSNKASAYVLERAKKYNIPAKVFTKASLQDEEGVVADLKANNIDLIVLAGFMLLVPKVLVQAFPDRIINIHPALLPAYGGKGMYGQHVHEAVLANKEAKSGITIHHVNEKYDEGSIIFQATCDITSDDTPDSLAQKIHQLEHQYFPQVIHDKVNEL